MLHQHIVVFAGLFDKPKGRPSSILCVTPAQLGISKVMPTDTRPEPQSGTHCFVFLLVSIATTIESVFYKILRNILADFYLGLVQPGHVSTCGA